MSNNSQGQDLTLGPISISKKQRRVLINRQELKLPKREFELLLLLVQDYDQDCVENMKFATVVLEWPESHWDKLDRSDQESIRKSFKTYKNNLTRKLDPFNLPFTIEAVPTKGYRFSRPNTSGTERLGDGQQAGDATLTYDESSINFYLHLRDEGANRFPLDSNESKWIIGRDSKECTVIINHSRVSGIHAIIFQKDGRWFICDQGTRGTGSTHGTTIFSQGKGFKAGIGTENGLLLNDGDLIQFAPGLFYRFEQFPLS
jgi:DNA-binding winged helix-turn-helix (wHTH) protein